MISSRKSTAVHLAVASLPRTTTSLAVTRARPGDLVSLNPQPLPPKEVSANLKAALGAPNATGLAVFRDQFVTTNTRADLSASAAAFKTLRRATDSFAKEKVDPGRQAALIGALKTIKIVDQLTKAESLMEESFKTLSNPNSNQVERIRAEDQRSQALELRKAVAPELSASQQKALWEVSTTEQKAMEDAKWAIFDMKYGNPSPDSPFYQKGLQDLEAAKQTFQLGVQENKSLIKWILAE